MFLPLTTTLVHKITHNKDGVVVPCFLELGWPGNPSPVEMPQGSYSFSPIALSSSRSSGSEQKQLDWFLKPESQVSSTFHFSVLFQQVALGKGGKKCWGILHIVFHPTLMITSKGPTHQNSAFGVNKWSPKLHSMFPPAWDLKVIIADTSKHTF